MDAQPVKGKAFMNRPDRFFHYDPLFTSSFSQNLIIPEAVMFSKNLGYEQILKIHMEKRWHY